jgi:uncharacterized membrane-anchored protein YitT (DUF2179 family)
VFKKLDFYKSILMIVVGTAVTAIGLDMLLIPMHIAPGGIATIASIINDFTPISKGVSIFVINIPLFLMSLKMNKSFFFKSLFGMIMFSVFIDLFTHIPKVTNDLFISAIFGGILSGTGFGIVFLSGGSSGGTDIAGWLLQRVFPNLKLGKSILIFDLVIIVIQGLIYGDITLSLYAGVALFTSAKMIDNIIDGINFAKTAYIISNNPEEISRAVIKELGRGLTLLKGKGMYTGEERSVLLCTVHTRQMPRLKKILKEVDPTAFVMLTDAKEVIGEGFGVHTT